MTDAKLPSIPPGNRVQLRFRPRKRSWPKNCFFISFGQAELRGKVNFRAGESMTDSDFRPIWPEISLIQ
ncbi:hypothetical protein ACE04B_11685, partial [Rhizobium phaseoli]